MYLCNKICTIMKEWIVKNDHFVFMLSSIIFIIAVDLFADKQCAIYPVILYCIFCIIGLPLYLVFISKK